MSNYIKQNFKDGDTLTASHLNYIEDGIVNNILGAGFAGKTVSFLADSITTFEGWIPSGYACWYKGSNMTNSGIDAVNKTWWKQVLNALNMKLCVNAAWSGSTAYGDSTSTTNAFAACSTARISDLTVKGGVASDCPVGTTPDIIIVFIGINDFGSHNKQVGNWDMKTLPAEGNQTTFDTAYALCIKKLMDAYPNAEIFCCTLLETTMSGNYDDTAGWPTDSNVGMVLNDYNTKIREIANLFGANIIDLHACGINYFNCSNFCVDNLHPNIEGAKKIANKVITELCAKSIYSRAIIK